MSYFLPYSNTPCIVYCYILLLPAAQAEAARHLSTPFSWCFITRRTISCNVQRTLKQCYMVAV